MVYFDRLFIMTLICASLSFATICYADNIETKKNNEIEKLVIGNKFDELKLVKNEYSKNVIDGYTINVDGGKIFELTGIYYPDDIFHGQDNDGHGKYYLQGKEFIEKELAKEKLDIYQTKNKQRGRKNRMGHQRAHIVRSKDKLWVQGELVKQGLAYAKVNSYNPEMATDLYKIEDYARKNKIGLWSDDKYNIISPDEAPNHISKYRIVEGTIKKAFFIKNTIYLNFGDDWRDDFTIMADGKMRKIFSMNGINLQSLANKKIRVRGWIEEKNGPMIKIDITEQLEIIGNDDKKFGRVISSSKFKGFGHIKVKKKEVEKELPVTDDVKEEENKDEKQ